MANNTGLHFHVESMASMRRDDEAWYTSGYDRAYYSIDQAQATQALMLTQWGHRNVMIRRCDLEECRL